MKIIIIIIIYKSTLYQNNEALVLERFIQIFGMASAYSSVFLAILKNNRLVPNQPRYY
jgi:hypothetical protein